MMKFLCLYLTVNAMFMVMLGFATMACLSCMCGLKMNATSLMGVIILIMVIKMPMIKVTPRVKAGGAK